MDCQDYGKAIHDTVDTLCGFTANFIENYQDGLGTYYKVQELLKVLVSAPEDQVQQIIIERLKVTNSLSSDISTAFLLRKPDYLNYMKEKLLNECRMTCFDWSVSLVLSSSKSSLMSTPVLILSLRTPSETVQLEFTALELEAFISQLNAVNREILKF